MTIGSAESNDSHILFMWALRRITVRKNLSQQFSLTNVVKKTIPVLLQYVSKGDNATSCITLNQMFSAIRYFLLENNTKTSICIMHHHIQQTFIFPDFLCKLSKLFIIKKKRGYFEYPANQNGQDNFSQLTSEYKITWLIGGWDSSSSFGLTHNGI